MLIDKITLADFSISRGSDGSGLTQEFQAKQFDNRLLKKISLYHEIFYNPWSNFRTPKQGSEISGWHMKNILTDSP
jgi:hypothetical protein